MDVFALIADERRALADVLDDVSCQRSRTPSLCSGWSVHDVAAHVVMMLEVGAPEFFRALLRARGSFDRANATLTAKWAKRSTSDLAAAMRHRADSRFTPPGVGPEGPLADHVVHALDIARPLHVDRSAASAAQRSALDFLAGFSPMPGQPGPTLVAKGRLSGLRLEAIDLDWTHGQGQVVSGRADDLLLAMTGRRCGVADLTGDGVTLLRRRIA